MGSITGLGGGGVANQFVFVSRLTTRWIDAPWIGQRQSKKKLVGLLLSPSPSHQQILVVCCPPLLLPFFSRLQQRQFVHSFLLPREEDRPRPVILSFWDSGKRGQVETRAQQQRPFNHISTTITFVSIHFLFLLTHFSVI
jgi:hypothetical protein